MSNVFGPKKPLFAPYTYRAKQDSNGNTLLAIYHGSKRIAHMDAYWAYSMRRIESHEVEEIRLGRGKRLVCATDLRALGAEGNYPNVLVVGHAFMDDDAYKGKGIGRAMYEAMMVEGFAVRETRVGGTKGPMFFIPDDCGGGGSTSADAKRVWASLVRDYPSQGTSIRLDAPPVIGSRAKANPRRLRNGTKAQARALLDEDICGGARDDNFYHVTAESRLDAIARYGLVPGKPANFANQRDYSAGKVFVSHGLSTARLWEAYLYDTLDEGDRPVILRIRPEAKLRTKVYLDEKGTEDAGCSFYLTSTVKPQHLAVLSEEEEERLPRRRNPRRRNPSVFDTLSPGTPNAVREQLQRLSRDDLARLQDELNALDDASIARFTGMTRLWHGAPASIADKIRERGFARTKGRRSGFMGSTFEVDNLALFLTENKALADAFGRSRSGRGEGTEVLEVYADLRQPLDLTVWTKVPKPLRALGEKLLAAHGGSKKPKQEDLFWFIDQPAFMDAVRHLGYDAVRFHESAETVKSLGLARKGEVTVAVLDPARLHVAPPPRGTLGSLLSHLDRSRK